MPSQAFSSTSSPPSNLIEPAKAQLLVVGYGNTLRSDDGAGQKVAEIVGSWNLPQVSSLAVHQLTPELANLIAEVDLAIFVDVYAVPELLEINEERNIEVIPLHAALEKEPLQNLLSSHISTPLGLLSLAKLVYGKAPSSWWILIPAWNFEFGEQISTNTNLGITKVVEQIKQIIAMYISEPLLIC